MSHSGHCFCGAVTWSNAGQKTRNLNCHCDECRRGVSAAFSSVMGLPAQDMQINGPWADYKFTAESSRAFCTCCGSRIWFRSDLWPDEVFVNVGVLDDPQTHQPDQHVLYADAVPWAPVADDIPKSAGFQNPVEDAPNTAKAPETGGDGLSGRCLCGEIRWQTDAGPLWAGHCHCDSCRRATGAPFTSFFGVPRDQVQWAGKMTNYTSRAGQMVRKFCSHCGTHMTIQFTGWPDETHLYAATLNDPAQFQPKAHFHYADKLPWVSLDDTLPRYPGSADTTEPMP